MRLPIVLLLWSTVAQAQLLTISQSVLVTGVVLDCHSSHHKGYELNPLLRSADGRLGTKGVSIKLGGTAVAVVLQRIALKRLHGKAKRRWGRVFKAFNFVAGGASVGVAVRNYKVSERINK